MKYFKDIHLSAILGKVVFLDIDGTIAHDKREEILSENLQKIDEIRNAAKEIYLLSNGKPDRTARLAKDLNLNFINSTFQKPNPKVLQNYSKDDSLIIGDKFLTDGLLSLFTGIPYIHVKSLSHHEDSFLQKAIYFFDDILGQAHAFFKLVRPKQWIKNLLVFAPVFFAGSFFDLSVVGNAILAFVAFTISASLVYVVNDYLDIENDRLHPKKKFRPLALGNISQNFLYLAVAFLIIILILILQLLPNILPLILIYIFANLAYSFKLKNIPAYDISLVAFMYLLRALVGGFATGIFISPWLVVCIFFAALFMITAKRFGEFENPTRKVLKFYSRESLVALLVTSGALSIATYTVHSILIVKNELSVYSSLIVTAIFFVTLNDILTGHKKMESPELYFLTNRKIIFLVFCWFAYQFWSLHYFF